MSQDSAIYWIDEDDCSHERIDWRIAFSTLDGYSRLYRGMCDMCGKQFESVTRPYMTEEGRDLTFLARKI